MDFAVGELAVADPGFSQGGRQPSERGGAGIKFHFFLRKLHEIEKNLAAGGGGARAGGAPLDPPLIRYTASPVA